MPFDVRTIALIYLPINLMPIDDRTLALIIS